MLPLHSRIVVLGYKIEATGPRENIQRKPKDKRKDKERTETTKTRKNANSKKPDRRHWQLAAQSSRSPRRSSRIKPSPPFLSSKRLRLRSSQTDHQIAAMPESSEIWSVLQFRPHDSHKDCTPHKKMVNSM